jgi:hypothetical protein
MATHDHAIVDVMRRRVVQLEDGRVIRDQRSGAYEIRVQSNVQRAEEQAADDALLPDDDDAIESDENLDLEPAELDESDVTIADDDPGDVVDDDPADDVDDDPGDVVDDDPEDES